MIWSLDALANAVDEFIHIQSGDLQGCLAGATALLHGHSPYQGTIFDYPFPIIFIYVPLALLPLWLAWGVVLIANVSILVTVVGRRALLWMLYLPLLTVLLDGQNDLWFLFLERQLKRGTRSAMLAALTTLKPQLAFILLPFHLQRWWREDRPTLASFAAFSAILWIAPWRWLGEWIASTLAVPNRACPPSIWAACGGSRAIPLPTIALVAVSLLLIYVALKSKREVAIPSLQLAAPVGMLYDTSLLVGLAPAWLMLPLSWILCPLYLVQYLAHVRIPLVDYGLPLAVLLYNLKYGSALMDRQAAGATRSEAFAQGPRRSSVRSKMIPLASVN